MEIVYKISIGQTKIAVGHHHGVLEVRPFDLHEDELQLIKDLSPRKRSEWLASRELLYHTAELPEKTQCMYDDFGKPYLKGSDKHISVSHSELWCSAMVSHVSCGVDIQVYTDTVRRISDRFLSSADKEIVNQSQNPIRHLHLLWGAKECLYKAYGKRKLGFREHIFITAIDEENEKAQGEIRFEGILLYYDIYFRMLPEVAWVFCMERTPTFFYPR